MKEKEGERSEWLIVVNEARHENQEIEECKKKKVRREREREEKVGREN